MGKLMLAPLLFLCPMFALSSNTKDEYKAALTTSINERENYTLVSIDDSSLGDEMRIYNYDDLYIDEIANNAFDGTSFTSLALSNCVTIVGESAFANVTTIKTLYYTGSEEEFLALGIEYEFDNIYYYAIDEGFINYWNKEVRPTKDTNICEITTDQYNYIRELYTDLNTEDKAVVDAYVDLAGVAIKDSIKQLNKLFASANGSNTTEEWNQTGAITLIIIIAVIGMTSITVFFLLKTKQIIK